MRKPILLLAVIAGLLAPSVSAKDACSPRSIRNSLETVRKLGDLGVVYIEDAAGDGSVVKIPPEYHSIRPEVAAVLQCGSRAAAILIEHLDDTRPTSAEFSGGSHRASPIRVPFGVVSLDLLMSISTFDSPVRDSETEDNDGLGCGFKAEYYFRPDEFETPQGASKASSWVLKVKFRWRRALARSQLKFEYSKWHRGEF